MTTTVNGYTIGPNANLRGADLREADLRWVDLREADLQMADLQMADLREADLKGANLRGADLREADLKDANLQRVDLRGANLQRADLRGANLDFSALPLSCGSLRMMVDPKLIKQFLYHALDAGKNDPSLFKLLSPDLLDYVNEFHQVGTGECKPLKMEDWE